MSRYSKAGRRRQLRTWSRQYAPARVSLPIPSDFERLVETFVSLEEPTVGLVKRGPRDPRTQLSKLPIGQSAETRDNAKGTLSLSLSLSAWPFFRF